MTSTGPSNFISHWLWQFKLTDLCQFICPGICAVQMTLTLANNVKNAAHYFLNSYDVSQSHRVRKESVNMSSSLFLTAGRFYCFNGCVCLFLGFVCDLWWREWALNQISGLKVYNVVVVLQFGYHAVQHHLTLSADQRAVMKLDLVGLLEETGNFWSLWCIWEMSCSPCPSSTTYWSAEFNALLSPEPSRLTLGRCHYFELLLLKI